MYEPRKKVLWFGITSRMIVFGLQFIFNVLSPDHQADAFRSPENDSLRVSLCDKIVSFFFDGLTRWDGQYFIHIAKYGYTYENTLAFYPLYPITIRIAASCIRGIIPVLNVHSAVIVAAFLINIVCFVKSAVVLYDLSLYVFRSKNVAYKAAILYCVNPASIFFSSVYSESLFAYLTFSTMLASVKSDPFVSFPLGLSMLVRSNGLVNLGFPMYFKLSSLCREPFPNLHSSMPKEICRFIFRAWRNVCSVLNILVVSLAPFVLLQVYNYTIFCVPQHKEPSLPLHVIDYGIKNRLTLQGNGSLAWCKAPIPIAYSYIQSAYWNVGFLKYYELKQIPNFMLASPILYIVLVCVKEYVSEHPKHFRTLGLRVNAANKKDRTHTKKYPEDLLVFVVHGLFLSLFCIFLVHIQVSTRLICSASPLCYWYCALTMSKARGYENSSNTVFENEGNLNSRWKVFFLSQERYDLSDKLILSYFLGYTVLGSFMFSNFLPWT